MNTEETLPEINYLELEIIYKRDVIARNIEIARNMIYQCFNVHKKTPVVPDYLKRNTRFLFHYTESDLQRDLKPEDRQLLDKILDEANEPL